MKTKHEYDSHDKEYSDFKLTKLGRGVLWTVGVAASFGAAAGIGLAYEHADGPDFSEQNHTYVVGQGEGVTSAAETIDGINHIDVRDANDYILHDPANSEVLVDGLQVGEKLVVPDSVEQ